MHGEVLAYANYALYVQHARTKGKKQLAALFERAALIERFQHFAGEAELAGVVGSDAEENVERPAGHSPLSQQSSYSAGS
jgi:rubrerythrin